MHGAKYSTTAQAGLYHTGVDMYSTSNADIYSAHSGIVTVVGGTYGMVGIYDEDKNVTYLYLHMDTTDTEAVVGEWIDEGTFIGTQSHVGLTSGDHLHIEVRSGRRTAAAALPTITESLNSLSPYEYL